MRILKSYFEIITQTYKYQKIGIDESKRILNSSKPLLIKRYFLFSELIRTRLNQ